MIGTLVTICCRYSDLEDCEGFDDDNLTIRKAVHRDLKMASNAEWLISAGPCQSRRFDEAFRAAAGAASMPVFRTCIILRAAAWLDMVEV